MEPVPSMRGRSHAPNRLGSVSGICKLPAGVTALDYNTITEVVLHLKYTARDGGEQLRSDATASLQTKINSMLVSLKDTGLTRMFSARHEFPTEWFAFLNAAAGTDQVLTLNLTRDRFPYFASVATGLKIKQIELHRGYESGFDQCDSGAADARNLELHEGQHLRIDAAFDSGLLDKQEGQWHMDDHKSQGECCFGGRSNQ